MIIRDFICRKCGIMHKDVILPNADIRAFCEVCENEMEIVFSKMSFKKRFKDSHDAEYTKTGRKND